jgi:transcriptional regulator GlxA family with amidase domain
VRWKPRERPPPARVAAQECQGKPPVGSICTGAFLLGAAGLFKGERVTTHWKWAEELATRCADATVDSDPISIRDGRLCTTAGITAGMDLALALVQEDLGQKMAIAVAREMVLYLKRPGGQSQFSAALALQAADTEAFAELQSWVSEHLTHDLTVEILAERCRMSARNFSRKFLAEIGSTPGRFVERVRVEAVRRRLEESSDGLERIAVDCGFGSADALRRTFVRVLRVSPREYRARFSRRSEVA